MNKASVAVKRGYAEGPFGQVHYCDTVAGADATLVLLHQAPLSLRQFDSTYALFAAAGVRAVGIDLPGFGASDWQPSESAGVEGPYGERLPRVEDYAEVVPAVLDQLGVASAHLCGHHTGAMVCSEASLRWPERVRSLTLSGPAPLEPEEQREFIDTIVAREKAYAPVADGSHLTELWESRIAYLPERTDAAELCTSYILQPLMSPSPFWLGHQAAFTYDATAALARVTHPTLVLANTTDMIFHLAERTLAMRPDFAYAEIEGGGVDPTDLITEPWTRAVLDFIAAQA